MKSGHLLGGVFSDLPYAGIHDTGGRIPESGNASPRLTIPLTKDAKKYRARSFPGDLSFKPGGKKPNVTGILFEETGSPSSPIQPQYALAKWIKLKPTHYIEEARDKVSGDVAGLIGDGALAILRGKA